MPVQQQTATSTQEGPLPWWTWFCRWLWKIAAFLGGSVVLGLGVNVLSTWLTSSKGNIPADAPLGELTTYWPITLLVGCCLFLVSALAWAISKWNTSTTQVQQPTTQDRERMLGRLRLRYEQMQTQSLQGAVQMELGLSSKSAAVQNTASLFLRLPHLPEQLLPSHISIVDVYELAQHELLILGDPGAGKSTLLLNLAHHLVEQSAYDTTQPLPVLLPLSSWATKRRPLQEWLSEQFVLLYDVPRDLSQQWVQTKQLLFLLDGLDEMEAPARAACITAINAYHREHLQPLVICSRTNEYDTSSNHERLALHAAVIVQPLSLKKVDAYLENIGIPLTALRTALKRNAVLAELATTPLMLQVLILAYYGISIRELSHKEAQLQQQIWDDYVKRMIIYKGDTSNYPFPLTVTWLSWLAQQMRKHNQTIFFLEQLQPNWLSKNKRIFYHWSLRLVLGLIFGLIGGLVLGLIFWLVLGLIGELIGGLVFWLVFCVIFGLFFCMIFGLFFWMTGRLYFGMFFWLSGVLIFWLSGGLIFWLSGGLSGGLIFWLFFWLRTVIQHYILRFWLWRTHLFPWKTVSFLDDATSRILLRRVGGGYSFTHRLLLEYFANLEKKDTYY